MKRNTERFEYVEISLLRESDLYRHLTADAKKRSQSLAQTIKRKLDDQYETQENVPISSQRSEPLREKRVIPVVQETVLAPSPKKSKGKARPAPMQEETGLDEAIPAFDLSRALDSADLFDL